MRIQRDALLLVVLLTTTHSLAAVHQPVDQHALAEQLLGSDLRERSQAVEAVQGIGVQNLTPELRAALITSLAREGKMLVQREEAGRRGEFLAELKDPEFIGRISRVVAELHDPQAIPALASALGTGFTVIHALVEFGERAAPAVLTVVSSKTLHYAVDDGLITLRFLVENAPTRPLSARTLDEIRRVTAQRLKRGTGLDITTLWRAIDLAAVLNDRSLRRDLESLATNWNEVVARGVTDPDLIEKTQKLAADRLAGIPPLPRQ